MKLHKHPLRYIFAPKWLDHLARKLVRWRYGEDGLDFWLYECTPFPVGPPFVYQALWGIAWSLGIGSVSTMEDEL